MQAAIIVRSLKTDRIAQLFYVPSLDEVTVSEAVRGLEQSYPPAEYRVDTSQVEYARQARAA